MPSEHCYVLLMSCNTPIQHPYPTPHDSYHFLGILVTKTICFLGVIARVRLLLAIHLLLCSCRGDLSSQSSSPASRSGLTPTDSQAH
ncbi:hypothetical protein CALVIDRAFT_332566 [Calocera viscosa TUFC12733]|uniref:Uncharacterized protein n=1 Tax=Calocera viscosa (strain TUFC12733) TaxID=1330018 RepID=A0A167HPL0_CALVF|nr:hypothetical protein CALVIDRAFT_332566 [Calocera viscosa TUFC12733]